MSRKREAVVVRHVRFVTAVGMGLNLLVAVLKGIGGALFSSQALIADAVHSLSDLATDIALILGVRFWSAPPDANHPYGHGKIETLVTGFIGLALTTVAVELALNAFKSISDGSHDVPGLFAFWIALFSIVSKEVLFHWTRREARRLRSPGMEANAWHHRSDAISSIPVAVAIVAANIFPALRFIDPLGAILVAVFILHASWMILKPALWELADGGGKTKALDIAAVAKSVHDVRSVHAVRARLVGTSWQADLHIQVDPDLSVRNGHQIAHNVKRAVLRSGLRVNDVIVHVEPYESNTERPAHAYVPYVR